MAYEYKFINKQGVKMRIDVSLKDENKLGSADNLLLAYYILHGEDWHRHSGVYFSQGNRDAAKQEFLDNFDKKE